jgi:hypothetical protein
MSFVVPFDLTLNLPRDPALMGFEDQAHRRAFHHLIVSPLNPALGPWQPLSSKVGEFAPSN